MIQSTQVPADLAGEIANRVTMQLRDDPRLFSPWFTPEDAAAYLRLKRRGLEDMRARGAGPKFHKVNDRLVRYHIRDLDAWLLSYGAGHE